MKRLFPGLCILLAECTLLSTGLDFVYATTVYLITMFICKQVVTTQFLFYTARRLADLVFHPYYCVKIEVEVCDLTVWPHPHMIFHILNKASMHVHVYIVHVIQMCI